MTQETGDDGDSLETDDSPSDHPEPRSIFRLIGAGVAFVIGLGYFWGAIYRAPYTVGSGETSYTLSGGVLGAFGVLMVFGAIVIAAEWYVSQQHPPSTE
jgi:hypothetical protein